MVRTSQPQAGVQNPLPESARGSGVNWGQGGLLWLWTLNIVFQLNMKSGLISHLRQQKGTCVFKVPFCSPPSNNRPGTCLHTAPLNMPLFPITPRRMGGPHVDVSKCFGLKVSPAPVPTALGKSRAASCKRISEET